MRISINNCHFFHATFAMLYFAKTVAISKGMKKQFVQFLAKFTLRLNTLR